MAKTILTAVLSGCLMAACTSTPPPEPPLARRTEIVVLKRTGYSDAAILDEEEGSYFWLQQAVSPAGIALSFQTVSGEHKVLHTVYFRTDSAVLSAHEKQALQRAAPMLRQQGVTLSGYADPRAGVEYNNHLAARRAESVARYLDGLGVRVNRRCIFGETRLPDSDLCEWRTQ